MDLIVLTENSVEPAIAQTLQQCLREGVTHFAALDEQRIYPTWRELLSTGRGIGFAIAQNGKAEGFLLGLLTFDMLTNEKQALEFLWLVAPSARRNGNGLRLLEAFENVAKNSGCVRVICGADERHAPKAMARLYRQRGYEPRIQTFSKKLE